jgi:SAM-dependent methyltransferase
MQEVKYDSKKALWDYKANTIVKDVPVEYFDDDLDAATYLARVKNGKSWKANVKRILNNFDPFKFGEFFYCRKCRRIEDGAHRLVIAKELGVKIADVRTGGSCYKNYVKAGRLIRRDSTFMDTFEKAMKANPTFHPLDKRWLEANAKDKWPLFSGLVDFRNKSFLDVGCNVGYSCIMAWSKMASSCLGVDIRPDVLKIGEKIASKLKAKDNQIQFYLMDWKKYNTDKSIKFDIVMCSGMLHYFEADEYERLFNKLLDSCKHQLIIEMRLRPNRSDDRLIISGIQTLPTDTWFINRLRNKGFIVKARFVRKPGSRELWVANKRKGV